MVKRRRSTYVARTVKRARRALGRLSYAANRIRRIRRRRAGIRMPKYRYHRYVSAITSNYAAGYFDETSLPFTIYPSATPQTDYPIAYSFKFSDIANNSEFSNLYDSYMITGVACYVKLVNNPNVTSLTGVAGGTATALSPVYPKLWYAIDHDDANVTTVSSLKEYGNVKCKTLSPNRMCKIWIPYPKIATSALGSSVRSAGVSKPMWLDMAYTDIIHYGLKMALDYQGAVIDADSYVFRVKLEFKYYFKCKDTR